MNTKRLAVLYKCHDLLQEVYDDLEMVRDEEEEAYDNMPEGLQESERGDMMQEAIDALDEALGPVETAADELDSLCSEAEEDNAMDYDPYEALKPGDKVKHKTMGAGTIKSIEGKYISVAFPEKEMKFLFPDAFTKGFLSL